MASLVGILVGGSDVIAAIRGPSCTFPEFNYIGGGLLMGLTSLVIRRPVGLSGVTLRLIGSCGFGAVYGAIELYFHDDSKPKSYKISNFNTMEVQNVVKAPVISGTSPIVDKKAKS